MNVALLLLGMVIGEVIMGAAMILFTLYLNKKRVGVYKVPNEIRKKHWDMIRKELNSKGE